MLTRATVNGLVGQVVAHRPLVAHPCSQQSGSVCQFFLTSMSFSITSFNLFFGLPFFEHSTTKFFAFTGTLSLFILSTCLNYCNLCSLKISSVFFMPVIYRIVSLLMLSLLSIFPQSKYNTLILVVCNFFSSFYKT